ncbi:MAG: hypothetical protein HUJ56_00935, partial [Erysipelotrichaceae bacterium]|nr:hypothetical protein [Erysipelotrichaceae bacterium]
MIVHPRERALKKLDELRRNRSLEISRLEGIRWLPTSHQDIEYNNREGKIKLRGRVFSYDDIQEIKLDIDEDIDHQVVHHEEQIAPEESHRKMNVGAGVVGALVGGPIAG